MRRHHGHCYYCERSYLFAQRREAGRSIPKMCLKFDIQVGSPVKNVDMDQRLVLAMGGSGDAVELDKPWVALGHVI